MKDADLPSVAVAARNLMELADYADLSTIMSNMNHRRTGYPFASTVDFATDADGHPIFCLTPLAMHTRNLAYNSRASLTVKMNGWGGLANARVTIFGDVQRLPPEYQAAANEVFKAKYEARKEDIDLEDRWGDYTFYRMNNVIDVYFVGGFERSTGSTSRSTATPRRIRSSPPRAEAQSSTRSRCVYGRIDVANPRLGAPVFARLNFETTATRD